MTPPSIETTNSTLSAIFGLSVVLLIFAMGTVSVNHYLMQQNSERIQSLEQMRDDLIELKDNIITLETKIHDIQ